MRSAIVPCGTTSSSMLPSRHSFSNTTGSAVRGNEQTILRTWPSFQKPGETEMADAGIVGNDGEILGALLDQAVDQRVRLANRAEAADQHDGAVADPGHRLGHALYDFVDHCELPPPEKGEGWGGGRGPQSQRHGNPRNLIPNSLYIFEDIVVPEAKDGNAPIAQHLCAPLIICMMAGLIMLPAVDFNCEANRRAIKIKNVPADWMLTPKTQAIELTTLQHIPRFSFPPLWHRGANVERARLSP